MFGKLEEVCGMGYTLGKESCVGVEIVQINRVDSQQVLRKLVLQLILSTFSMDYLSCLLEFNGCIECVNSYVVCH